MRKLLLVMSLLIASIGVAAPSAVADTGAESTGADQFSDTNLTAAMVAAGSIVHCTGYVTVASLTANGHTLSTKANTCGVYYGRNSSGEYAWGPVVRYKCYRDGVQFGAGTGGCRWKGSLSMYNINEPRWASSQAFALPGSQSSAFWDDSGRRYGPAYRFFTYTDRVQICQDDYLYNIGGGAVGNGVVHFMGATGIDYGTFNMANRCTATFHANDTS
jgi:hypothetical protein